MSYEDRLRKLQLATLRFRRLRGDMIETYEILTGKYDNQSQNLCQLKITVPQVTNLELDRQRAEKGLRQNFFTVRDEKYPNSTRRIHVYIIILLFNIFGFKMVHTVKPICRDHPFCHEKWSHKTWFLNRGLQWKYQRPSCTKDCNMS